MRALFVTQPAVSHLAPMVPIARELQRRGWQVAVAAPAPMAATVHRHELDFRPVGLSWMESEAPATFPELASMSLMEQSTWWVSEIFADRAARPAAQDLTRAIDDWSSDLIVRDYWEFGAWAAAEAAGVPCAVVGLAMHSTAEQLDRFIGPQLRALREVVGLDPDDGIGTLYAGPYIDLLPRTYQTQDPPHVVRTCPVPAARTEPDAPQWLQELPARPTVLVTFGTVFNRTAGVFEEVLAGLADEDINVVATVGRNRDPGELGTVPDNARVERFVPYDALLPVCDAVVCHAGLGTTMSALAHDLPVVAVPLSADQPIHAQRCAELGVGVHIRAERLSAGVIRTAVRDVLADERMRSRVGTLGSEIRSMPGPDVVADVLESCQVTDPVGSGTSTTPSSS